MVQSPMGQTGRPGARTDRGGACVGSVAAGSLGAMVSPPQLATISAATTIIAGARNRARALPVPIVRITKGSLLAVPGDNAGETRRRRRGNEGQVVAEPKRGQLPGVASSPVMRLRRSVQNMAVRTRAR